MSKGLHREELLVQDGRIEMNRVSGLEDEQDHTPVRVNE